MPPAGDDFDPQGPPDWSDLGEQAAPPSYDGPRGAVVDIDDGLPTFGDGEFRQHQFRLVMLHRGEKLKEVFTAHKEVDAGLVLRQVRAKTRAEQTSAAMDILLECAIDDDGLGARYQPPSDEDIEEQRGDDETFDEARIRLVDDRLEDMGQWSSRRRLWHFLDSPDYLVRSEAILELSRWLIGESAGRPTNRSASSRRGPGSTGRGSGGRRS